MKQKVEKELYVGGVPLKTLQLGHIDSKKAADAFRQMGFSMPEIRAINRTTRIITRSVLGSVTPDPDFQRSFNSPGSNLVLSVLIASEVFVNSRIREKKAQQKV